LPRAFFFFTLLLCVGALLRAQHANAPRVTLSLDDALRLGVENSLSLQRSLLDLSSAEYSANRLWAEVFPSISASIGASYGSRPLFSGSGSGSVGTSASLGLNLTLNAGIPFAMRNIRLAYQARLLGYEDARNQLELRITRNFYSLIADRDDLGVLTDMLQLAQMQYERDRVAFNYGRIGELTLMQSMFAVENARYTLSRARSAYANGMGDFLVLIGMAQDTDAELEGEIEITRVEIDAERLIGENLLRRPDIVSRRREIERLENAGMQVLYASRAPSLRLDAGWNARSFSPFADGVSGGATLSIPIDPWVPGTRSSQSIRNSRIAVEQARLDLQSTETTAAAQIRALAANLHDSWYNIEIARLGLSLAERGYELTEIGFRGGTVDSLRLEDARNNLVGARQRLLQSELLYLFLILDISAALNICWKELMQ
jgi:outer membrane protein